MKKFLALLLALAMTLALVACGEKKDDTKTDGAGDGEKTYKVAMICDSSINDGGWGAACYNAMVKAAEDKGWTYDVTDSISQDQYYETIVAFCNLGYDMIYAPGNQYTDAVLQAADVHFDALDNFRARERCLPGKADDLLLTDAAGIHMEQAAGDFPRNALQECQFEEQQHPQRPCRTDGDDKAAGEQII